MRDREGIVLLSQLLNTSSQMWFIWQAHVKGLQIQRAASQGEYLGKWSSDKDYVFDCFYNIPVFTAPGFSSGLLLPPTAHSSTPCPALFLRYCSDKLTDQSEAPPPHQIQIFSVLKWALVQKHARWPREHSLFEIAITCLMTQFRWERLPRLLLIAHKNTPPSLHTSVLKSCSSNNYKSLTGEVSSALTSQWSGRRQVAPRYSQVCIWKLHFL